MTETHIRLGQLVRDKVSGLEGIVSSRCEPLTGALQFGVQPKGKGDQMLDAHFIDHFTLEVKGKGVSEDVPPVETDVRVGLQDVVCDRISGVTGVAVERITFLNGCVYFLVQPPAPTSGPKKGEMPDRIHCNHNRLEVVTAAVTRPAMDAVTPSKRGGPARSVRSVIGR